MEDANRQDLAEAWNQLLYVGVQRRHFRLWDGHMYEIN